MKSTRISQCPPNVLLHQISNFAQTSRLRLFFEISHFARQAWADLLKALSQFAVSLENLREKSFTVTESNLKRRMDPGIRSLSTVQCCQTVPFCFFIFQILGRGGEEQPARSVGEVESGRGGGRIFTTYTIFYVYVHAQEVYWN